MGELATSLVVLFIVLWLATRWYRQQTQARTEPADRGTGAAKGVDR